MSWNSNTCLYIEYNDWSTSFHDCIKKVINLLIAFSFVDSNTLFVLIDSYCMTCMSIYENQLL